MAWPAIIAAAGALAQTGLNVSAQNSTNERNWRRQQHVNAQNWSHYLYDNNYNTPLNQVRRLRAAGLNPALMYDGGGSVATSTPPDSAQGSSDVAAVMTGLPTIADALAVQRSSAEISLLKSQKDKLDAETKTEEQLRSERLNALVQQNANLAKFTEEIAEKIKSYADQHKLTEAQLEQFKFDRVMQGKQYMLDKKRLAMDSKLTDKQISKLEADIQKTLAEKNVTQREYQEMVWTYAIRKSGLANGVNLSKAQIDQAKATARKLGIESDLDAPMAFTRRRMLSELNDGLIGAAASYAIYDVIDNFGRFIH